MDCREDGSGLFAQTLADGFILKLDPTDAFDLEPLGVTRDTINRAETILAQERIVNSAEFPDSFLFVFTPVVPQDQGGSQVYYENMPYRLGIYQQDGDSTWLAAEYFGDGRPDRIRGTGRHLGDLPMGGPRVWDPWLDPRLPVRPEGTDSGLSARIRSSGKRLEKREPVADA